MKATDRQEAKYIYEWKEKREMGKFKHIGYLLISVKNKAEGLEVLKVGKMQNS